MFCTTCGNKMPDQAKFCTSCGAVAARTDSTQGEWAPAPTAVAAPAPEVSAPVATIPAAAAPATAPKAGVPTAAIVLLVVAGLIVLLSIGGFAAFRAGMLDSFIDSSSKTVTDSDAKSKGSEKDEDADAADSDEADQDEGGDSASNAGAKTLTPQQSYVFLGEQWAAIQAASSGYGDRTSGWLTGSYSPYVTASDPAVRQNLANEGGEWVNTFKAIQTALSEAELDSDYEAERQEQLTIINALVARAESYFAAASAAAVNPEESYWRPYQAPANDLAQAVKDMMAAYTPPVQP